MNLKKFFMTRTYPTDLSVVLLLLRLYVGIAFMFHGYGKIQNPMGWMGPDAPIPGVLLALAAISEFCGGLSLIIGLLFRLSTLGILCTMAVATSFHLMHGDPAVNLTGGVSAEPAIVYLLLALLLFVSGPGKFSLDSKIFGNK
jgi:putative oxidoreductase